MGWRAGPGGARLHSLCLAYFFQREDLSSSEGEAYILASPKNRRNLLRQAVCPLLISVCENHQKTWLNENAVATLQRGRNTADDLSDCPRNKQRLINPLAAEVHESARLIASAGVTPPYKISWILRGSLYTCGRDDGRIAPTHCALTPVSSTGPETHAKHFALSYAFDLLRIFPQYHEGISTTLCSKSSQRGMLQSIDIETSSGTYIA